MRQRLFIFLALLFNPGPVVAVAQPNLPKFDSKYYVIYTDLDRDAERDIELRINIMAETYHQRTRAFSGQISKRLPFYIFRSLDDYHAAGGMPGSAGVFNGVQLMAVAGEHVSDFTWHVIQHEGFHQFAHTVIRGNMPPWLDEGLAEYFGESLFTGDSYVTGIIPPQRLQNVRKEIEQHKFLPLEDLMKLRHDDWNANLTGGNYDEAWAIVHFLAHADNNKYQKLTEAMMADIGRGMGWEAAWIRHFGPDFRAFEKRWYAFWLNLSADPTADLRAEATTRALTHFLAGAIAQKQSFDDVKAFFAAAKAGELKSASQSWLPPSLLKAALAQATSLGDWSLEHPRNAPQRLVCTRKSGGKFIGTFILEPGGRVRRVDVKSPGKTPPRKT